MRALINGALAFALVLGESEIADGNVVVKDLRSGRANYRKRRIALPRICAHFWVNLPGIISQEKDCVELYNNENDQVDALKRFFAENGKALPLG
ncbi:membrane protein [Klebsiella michiganensis]|uniref:Membrane protein n=1 Tax=Klebsiella michiganensis TaxID=1134687 RepID=A0A7H4PNF2_9ENTR|nr:membrane protein [Klebsiella michiganensis]